MLVVLDELNRDGDARPLTQEAYVELLGERELPGAREGRGALLVGERSLNGTKGRQPDHEGQDGEQERWHDEAMPPIGREEDPTEKLHRRAIVAERRQIHHNGFVPGDVGVTPPEQMRQSEGSTCRRGWHARIDLGMNSKASRFGVRVGLALRQNRGALLFIAAWLLANYVIFVRWFALPRTSAALVALCVSKASGGWPSVYQSFTEVVVFGVIASVVVTNVTRKYRPEETCRALAQRSSGHVVVIGWTNLGRRVADMVTAAGRSVVIVEENAALVAALVNEERPLVIGSAQERGVLEDAAVRTAKIVVIATDDLETAAVASRLVREVNATCELVIRCPDDEVGAVLAKTYRARAVSTSRLAASFIQGQAVKARARAVVVLGKNNFGDRVVEALADKRIPHSFADVTEDTAKLAAAGVAEADMVIVCDDDLGKNLVRVDRIRDLNKRARIICRAFHDDAAEVLGRPPFDCVVLSTSKYASEWLARSGAFREVGITDVPVISARVMLASA